MGHSKLPRIVVAAAAVFVTTALAARGQALVTVHGIAYDSLHGAPLAGAFIAIAGSSRTATSDDRGRFAFDSVAPGTYRFVMQHDALDSIGLSGAATRMAVRTDHDTVTISVPSFAALWRATCRTPTPAADSGLIFGTVRATGGRELASGAVVNAAWSDTSVWGGVKPEDAKGRTTVLAKPSILPGMTRLGWQMNVTTDSAGYYSVCGVPTATELSLGAERDLEASGTILVQLDQSRVMRRDLMLGQVAATARGTIMGVVTGEAGKPLRDALIVSDMAPEARTDADGRFILRDVPAGTQQFEARAIGLAPVVATVDVIAHDTAHVAVQLSKVVTLDTVRTKATPETRLVAAFEARKKAGWGTYRDSTTIGKHGTVTSVFAEMPSVSVRTSRRGIQLLMGARQCAGSIWIDGNKADGRDLLDLRPDDIATIEVYSRATEIPTELLASSRRGGCGAAIIWTKRIWP